MIERTVGPTAKRHVMYACTSTYVALCSVWLALFLLWSYLTLVRGTDPKGMMFSGAIFVAVVSWVRSFRIELTDDGIDYRFPFLRHRRVKWSNVASVQSGVRWQPAKSLFYMTIATQETSTPVSINIKVFSKADLSALVRAIKRWAPQAALDKRTARMISGEMPSIVQTEARRP